MTMSSKERMMRALAFPEVAFTFHKDARLAWQLPAVKTGQNVPYAINAAPGASLHLELQTPEWRGPMPIARGPIAIGAAGPGSGGRMMMGYPPVDAAMLKPMQAAMTLHLAADS